MTLNNNQIASILVGLLLAGTLLYPTFQPYLVFIVMNALVFLNTGILYSNLDHGSGWTGRILGISVLAFTQITLTQLYPGLLGYLTFDNVMLAQIICLSTTLLCVWLGWLRMPSWQRCRQALSDLWQSVVAVTAADNRTILSSILTGGIFAFVFAVSALNPPISIDTLTFHFVEPAKWLQTGHVPSQLQPGYAHTYGMKLLTTWLMFPFHHDFLARFSQTPVILLGALAGYGIGCQLGMPRPLALITASAVLTFPAYLANGITLTDPDTLLAGTLLISLYFAVSLAQSYKSGTVLLLALSLGLLLESKYNSLYYGAAIIWLVIHAWNKGRKSKGWSGAIMAQGVMLTLVPVAVGGAAYLLYDYSESLPIPFNVLRESLTTGFTPDAIFNPFTPKFSLISFVISPGSLRNMGLALILGLIAIYGIVKLLGSSRWQELVLPIFLCLPIVVSLGVYKLFGYYPDHQATRHLLGTIALCVILGGWTVSVLEKPNQSYGAWGLVGIIVISTVLGFFRQWPLHQLPTNLAAMGIAVLVAGIMWWLLVYIRRTGGLPGFVNTKVLSVPALLFISWLGIHSLHGWEFLYRDYKYARWPPFYGFGTSWTWLANATADHGARIACNRVFYPIFGYDLMNTPVQLMPDVTPQDTQEERQRQLEIWEDQLHQSQIDYLYLFAIGPSQTDQISQHDLYDILETWMAERSGVYTRIFKNDRELVYRLNSSTHIMSHPSGWTP